jgi:hypothetical protein
MNSIETHRNPGTKYHQNLSRSSEHAIWGMTVVIDALCVHSVHKNKKHNNLIYDMIYLRIE